MKENEQLEAKMKRKRDCRLARMIDEHNLFSIFSLGAKKTKFPKLKQNDQK